MHMQIMRVLAGCFFVAPSSRQQQTASCISAAVVVEYAMTSEMGAASRRQRMQFQYVRRVLSPSPVSPSSSSPADS